MHARLLWIFAAAACARGDAPGSCGPGGKADFLGDDDRQQIDECGDPRCGAWARSVALIARASRLERRDDGAYRACAATLADQHGVCADERFADEPALGFCSSWLVAPDLVATAGHCVTDGFCGDLAFVFDFHSTGGSANLDRIPADRVFRCREIVAREFELGGRDYALVRLDRPAYGRRPFEIDVRAPALGARVAMVGFPSGIYAKVDLGGRILRARGDELHTTLDSFPGHSGSVVIDLATGRAFAVHTAGGRPAYVLDGECTRAASCSLDDVEAGACTASIERLAEAFAGAAGAPSSPPAPSCEGRCGDDGAPPCACDLACSTRGDCCADVAIACGTTPDAPACIDPGGPCTTDADCANAQCSCEGEYLVTETFVAARGRCVQGTCAGDVLDTCHAACARDGLVTSTWGTTCFPD